MSGGSTVIIDDSPAGAWHAALDREGACCAACRQRECGHSDMVYQGVMPPPEQAARETTA